MKRREALKNLGLSLGTITITPTVLGLLQSCQEDLGWNPVFFNKKHIKIISDISDLIIPSDDKVPGSKELNLIKFIDLYVLNVNSKNDQKLLFDSTNFFMEDCLIKSNKISLDDIDSIDIEKSLDYYFNSNNNKWRSNFSKFEKDTSQINSEETLEANSYHFLSTIRQLTITAFKGNEFIGEKVLAYSPIPGQQKGCVDLEETTGGRAWSL
tara:strand:+ start:214 stop:846 length:633 start_codon:yes stop_codon:yes gene_type:complete